MLELTPFSLAHDCNVPIELTNGSFWGIGSLAIGNMKYKVQYGLYQKMQHSSKAALFDFPQAYEYANAILHESAVEEESKHAA